MKRIKQPPLTSTTITIEEYRADRSVTSRYDVVNVTRKNGKPAFQITLGRVSDKDICPNCGQEIP